MPRKPDERIIQAKELYLKGLKLVEIASQLSLPEGTVRRWKSTYKWDNERSDKNSERSDKKKGGQPSNKNAEKHGFFSKYLPEETFSIIQDIEKKNPLDILWENIQIAYAAIVRAQQIMYVKDHEDKTIEKIEEKEGRNVHLEIEVPKGYRGCLYIESLAIKKYKNQQEVLFKRGFRCKIKNIEKENDRYYIKAEAIL